MSVNDAIVSIIAGVVSSLLAVLAIEFAHAMHKRFDHRALRKVLHLRREVCIISTAAVRSESRWELVAQREAHAYGYLANLALRLGVDPEIIDAKHPPENQAPTDEFCVGGPLTNIRTREILRRYIAPFEIVLTENAKSATPDLDGRWVEGFSVSGYISRIDPERGFAFLGKLDTDADTTAHVVFGITDVGVAAAAYYLHTHYRDLARLFGERPYFVALSYSLTFGFKSVVLDADHSNLIADTRRAASTSHPGPAEANRPLT
jgi:hypothetical protein